jgi:DNA-binding NtrC family response regulator
MAPLPERPSDIPILAQHFVHQACVEAGIPIKTLSREAADALVRAPWPGNVRELLNVISASSCSRKVGQSWPGTSRSHRRRKNVR